MAYATIAELITYAAHTSDFASDNANSETVLNYDAAGNALTRAQKIIETLTQRVFEASSGTRYFDAYEDVDGLTLLLDADLYATDVSATDLVITNGDGVAVSDADFILEPRNDNPRWGITLKGSTGLYWDLDSDGNQENAISIAGKWGYSATAPDDIKHATLALAVWLYKRRTSDVSTEAPIVTPQGVLVLPGKIPGDVMSIVSLYARPRIHL